MVKFTVRFKKKKGTITLAIQVKHFFQVLPAFLETIDTKRKIKAFNQTICFLSISIMEMKALTELTMPTQA